MSFFDTDFVIDLLREQRRGGVGPAHRKLEQLGETPVRLSVFVLCELEAGAARYHDPEEVQRVRRLCQHFEIVYPDDRFAPQYGETLAALKQQKLTVATMDLLIGTLALVENDTLVTRNVRHFGKIPRLRIEKYGGGARR
jgi:predicted nucleic acid-binding protein